jgi:hypothetical protein
MESNFQFRLLFFILSASLLLALSSCSDFSKGKFRLTNNTQYPIDSICIAPDKQFGHNYIFLKPNEIKNYEIDISGYSTDGSYLIQYKTGLYKKVKIFGYYSNGNSMEKLTKIYFEADTIQIEPIY